MEASRRRAVYSENAKQSIRDQRSPGDRRGVSQREAVDEWGVYTQVLLELENSGKLVGIHVGNRVWYSRAQLTELLGIPRTGPHRPATTERDAKGGCQQVLPLAA